MKTTKNKKKPIFYTVIFTPEKEGGYTATVPALPGCISEGNTFEEAKKNIAEAISLYVETVKPSNTKSIYSEDFIVAPVRIFA